MPMKMDSLYSRQTRYRVPVIALHCSGAGASEWYSLAEALGDDYELLAPEHYGSASNGAWTGEHAFTLADDAARAIALVDASQSKGSPRRPFVWWGSRATRGAGAALANREYGALRAFGIQPAATVE